jgi:single-strand DNA-binding protein
MWGDRVEKLSQHLIKGQQLFVTLGEPHIEDYDRKDGTKGTSLRARLNELEFAGAAQNNQPKPKDVTFDDLKDDIPF